jgi:hypothetical protein
MMHPEAVVQHLGYIWSDHRPILLDTDYHDLQSQPQRGPRRFEAKWLREKGFREVVLKPWEEATVVSSGVLGKLEHTHAAIHEWDATVLKAPKKRLRKAQRDLQDAMNGDLSDENDAKAKEMANLIEILMEQEEIYWAQRSRANWIQHGDRNTYFFIILLLLVERRISLRSSRMIIIIGWKVQML